MTALERERVAPRPAAGPREAPVVLSSDLVAHYVAKGRREQAAAVRRGFAAAFRAIGRALAGQTLRTEGYPGSEKARS